MADTTAAPAAPEPASVGMVSALQPPIATTGIDTAWQIARNSSGVKAQLSGLVGVATTAPTPR